VWTPGLHVDAFDDDGSALVWGVLSVAETTLGPAAESSNDRALISETSGVLRPFLKCPRFYSFWGFGMRAEVKGAASGLWRLAAAAFRVSQSTGCRLALVKEIVLQAFAAGWPMLATLAGVATWARRLDRRSNRNAKGTPRP